MILIHVSPYLSVGKSESSNLPDRQVPVNEAAHPEKVKVYGPGIETASQNVPTFFTVDCKEAGPGALRWFCFFLLNLTLLFVVKILRIYPKNALDMKILCIHFRPNGCGSGRQSRSSSACQDCQQRRRNTSCWIHCADPRPAHRHCAVCRASSAQEPFQGQFVLISFEVFGEFANHVRFGEIIGSTTIVKSRFFCFLFPLPSILPSWKFWKK